MRRVFSTILLASFLLAQAPSASACSCIENPPPREAMDRANAVFAGRAVKVDMPWSGPVQSSIDPVTVTFEVSRSWKGPLQKSLLVKTVRDSASCGYGFEEGEEYLVYTHGESGELNASLCSRTALLAAAPEDLSALGPGQIPQENIPASQLIRFSPWTIAIGFALGAMIGFFLMRIKKAG